MRDLPIHAFETYDGSLTITELSQLWESAPDSVPAVIVDRGLWIGTVDRDELRFRLDVGDGGMAVRDVLSPDLHYCFEDTDPAEAFQFARVTGSSWMGVLDGERRLAGLVSRADLEIAARDSARAESPDRGRARDVARDPRLRRA